MPRLLICLIEGQEYFGVQRSRSTIPPLIAQAWPFKPGKIGRIIVANRNLGVLPSISGCWMTRSMQLAIAAPSIEKGNKRLSIKSGQTAYTMWFLTQLKYPQRDYGIWNNLAKLCKPLAASLESVHTLIRYLSSHKPLQLHLEVMVGLLTCAGKDIRYVIADLETKFFHWLHFPNDVHNLQ